MGKSVLEFKREEEKSRCWFRASSTVPRRLFELLKSQGMTMNQQVTLLSGGGDDVRQVQQHWSPEPGGGYWLDWFHITMRITVMKQMAKGLVKASGGGHRRRPAMGSTGKSIEKDVRV